MKRPNASGWWAAGRAVTALLALSLFVPSCEDPVTLQPSPEAPPGSPEALVTALSKAYQQRDPELFRSLLANEHGANADYLFLLSAPTDLGELQWGYAEEVRIHQRMFRPDQSPPPAVPSDLWLHTIQITLTPLEEFQERPGLYSANAGEDGKLDPLRWRAVGSRYSADVLFDLEGTDYRVRGQAHFTVIEDLTKRVGDTGKFLLLIWEDFGARFPRISEGTTWSGVKGLFR